MAAFMEALEHPHKETIELLRELILGTDKRITEEVKWNAPSFKLAEHFATLKLYPPKNVQLVLHTGAKTQRNAKVFTIEDPHKLLKWPATDRCVLTLASEAEFTLHRAEVKRIVEQWLAQL